MDAFAFGAVAIVIAVSIIHACLIRIDNLLFLHRRYLQSELGSFLLVSFLISVSLFFRVNPIFLSALEMVRSLILPSHSSAICAWV
jgi:hypothetical protein